MKKEVHTVGSKLEKYPTKWEDLTIEIIKHDGIHMITFAKTKKINSWKHLNLPLIYLHKVFYTCLKVGVIYSLLTETFTETELS